MEINIFDVFQLIAVILFDQFLEIPLVCSMLFSECGARVCLLVFFKKIFATIFMSNIDMQHSCSDPLFYQV